MTDLDQDLVAIIAKLEADKAELVGQIAALQNKVSGFIAGECSCPHSTGSASHFPGCPGVAQERIAELERRLDKAVGGLPE